MRNSCENCNILGIGPNLLKYREPRGRNTIFLIFSLKLLHYKIIETK